MASPRSRPTSRPRSRPTSSTAALAAAKVYAAIKKIPKGRVATYGQIASLSGLPRRARLVGKLLADLPNNIEIPWHRVVNAQGKISARITHWDSGSDTLQRIRLEAEGVKFSAAGSINLKLFRWEPK